MDNYTQANLMGKVAGSSLPHCAVSLSVSLLFRYGGQRHQRQSERVQKTLFFVFVVNADCSPEQKIYSPTVVATNDTYSKKQH